MPAFNSKTERQFYSAKEAARIIGMNYAVFLRWCRSDDPKKPPNRRFNGGKSARVYIPIKRFTQWLEQEPN